MNSLRTQRPRGGWLVLLVLVPLTAGGVAALRTSGDSYTAVGRLSVAEVVAGEGASTDQVDQLSARFETAFDDPATADEAASALGLPRDRVDRLQAQGVAGGLVEVRYFSDHEDTAEEVLDSATRVALSRMVQEQRQLASIAADDAARRTDAVAAELAQVQQQAGAVDVARAFDLVSADLLSLRNQVAAAESSDPNLARSLRAVMEQKQEEAAKLGQSLVAFRRLDASLTKAIDEESSAKLDVDRLDRLEVVARSSPVLLTSDVVSTPQAAQAATTGVVAAAVALAVLLVLYVALGSRGRPDAHNRREVVGVGPPADHEVDDGTLATGSR